MCAAATAPVSSTRTARAPEPQTRGYIINLARGFSAQRLELEIQRVAQAGFNLVLFPGYNNGWPFFPCEAFRARGTDLNATSVNVRWQNALGKPSWMVRTSAPLHYSHWTIPEAQWRVHVAACKANGGKVLGPCGAAAYPNTTTSKQQLETVKKAFAFFKQDADLDEDAESAARVAVVFSWTTRKYFGKGERLDHVEGSMPGL